MVFKDILKNLRNENGVTQEDLARYLNVTRPTIAGYETKGKEPDYKTLILISEYFDVSIDYLLTGREYTKKLPEKDIPDPKVQDLILEIQTKSSTLSEEELMKLLDYLELLILWKNTNC